MTTMDVNADCKDLIEAYLGFYGDADAISGMSDTQKHDWAIRMILDDSPKQRLRVYCEWNGIIGYDNRLYEIATQGIIAL